MKSKYYSLVSFITILTITYSCNYNNEEITLLNSKINELNDSINILVNRVLIHSDYNGGYKLNSDIEICSFEKESVCLKDIVRNYSIGLYIDKKHCKSCIDNYISELSLRAEDMDIKPFVFANGYGLRELKALKIHQDIILPLYSIKEYQSEFFSFISKAEFPFYFLIDSELKVSNVFFPSKDTFKLLNDSYFTNISKIIEKQNRSDHRIGITNVNLDQNL